MAKVLGWLRDVLFILMVALGIWCWGYQGGYVDASAYYEEFFDRDENFYNF